MQRHRRALVSLLAVLAVLAAACGAGTDTETADGVPTIQVTVDDQPEADSADTDSEAADQSDDGTTDDGTSPDDDSDDDSTDDDSADDDSTDDNDSDDDSTDDTTDDGPKDVAVERKGTLGDSLLATTLTGDDEANSARFHGELVFVPAAGSDVPTDITLTFDGAYDVAANASDVTIDFGDFITAAMAAEGGGDIEGMEFFAAFFEEPMRMITIGDTSWVQWSLLTMFTGAEGTWVEAEADESSGFTSDFGFTGSGSPTDVLEALKLAQAEITELGTETVRGVTTTHLRAVIDIEALAETLSEAERAELEAELGASGIATLPMEFWLGDDGLIYRYSMDLSDPAMLAETDGQFESARFLFEMYDYGADVGITPPPADQIISGDDLDFGF